MAEFCKDCFLEVHKDIEPDAVVLTEYDDFCERCGNSEPVVAMVKVAECKG